MASVAPICRAALVAVALVWAGMSLGVAFIAVPAQFAASGLSRPLGIDITRQVFTTYDQVELGLAVVTLALALVVRPGRLLWAMLVLLWLMVALRSAWLLPALDLRADQLLQGQEPPAGPWHGLFVGSEITKLVVLLFLAWVARPTARA